MITRNNGSGCRRPKNIRIRHTRIFYLPDLELIRTPDLDKHTYFIKNIFYSKTDLSTDWFRFELDGLVCDATEAEPGEAGVAGWNLPAGGASAAPLPRLQLRLQPCLPSRLGTSKFEVRKSFDSIGYQKQCFGSGSGTGSGSVLDPYSIGPLDPDPDP